MTTRRPTDQLEPSNLLAPLDLGDHWNLEEMPARAEPGAILPPRSKMNGPAPAPPRRRGAFTTALILIGAGACFAAGAAVSKFATSPFDGSKLLQTVAGATRPSAPSTVAPATKVQS